ncbi:MAG: hypothetical protein ABNH53_13300 [Henriciella sp.]
MLGLIESVRREYNGAGFEYDPRHHLIAQYIQGIQLSYDGISKGLYAQAANLQKQQIETLTEIREIKLGRRREGKTPKVGNSMPNMKTEYDNLNDVAHPGTEDVIYSLTCLVEDDKAVVSSLPRFDTGISRSMLLNHCHYLFILITIMQKLFDSDLSERLSSSEEQIVSLWDKFVVIKNSASAL